MIHQRIVVMAVVTMAALTTGQTQEGESCVDGNSQAGTCTSIEKCPPLRQLLQEVRTNTARPNALQFLRKSVCRLERNRTPLVCCQSRSPAVVSGGDLLPSRCGRVDLTDRIFDGEDAPLLAWPWMALLRGREQGQPSTWFCGGSIINDRYVLTAAHCFKGFELEMVRLGEHTLSEREDCEFGVCAPLPQDITAEKIITHPQYGSPCTECNDIALIRLSRPIKLDPNHVVPICLPVDPLKDMGFPEEEFQGKWAWAAGWGSVSRNPLRPRTPDKLQQVILPIREDTVCPEMKARVGYPDPRMALCAGGDGKDTCKGDSGGPLQLNNRVETRRFVVGITSVGPVVCGRGNSQALYTNVHYYAQWILDNLQP